MEVGQDFGFSRNDLMPVLHRGTGDMDESELELSDSELRQKGRDFRQFDVIPFRYDGIGHHDLPPRDEVSDALDYAYPGARGLDFGVMRARIVAVDRGSEFVRASLDEGIEIRLVGEFPAVGLNLDAHVTETPRIADQGNEIGMNGWFAPSEHDRAKAFVVFGLEMLRDFFETPLGVMMSLVPLNAKTAQIIACETYLHVDSLHGDFRKRIRSSGWKIVLRKRGKSS